MMYARTYAYICPPLSLSLALTLPTSLFVNRSVCVYVSGCLSAGMDAHMYV